MKRPFTLFFFATLLSVCQVNGQTLSDTKLSTPKPFVQNSAEVASIFPKTVAEIEQAFQQAKKNALLRLEVLVSIAPQDRTFENTVRECDRTYTDFFVTWSSIGNLQMVHPDKDVRDKAEQVLVACGEFVIDHFGNNQEIYRAYKEYKNGNANKENLTPERKYYFTEALDNFKRAGFDLDPETFAKMKDLNKKLDLLNIQFSTNIAQDTSSLCVKKEALKGVDEDFINSLKQEGDTYTLVCDYPTRAQIMENCTVESTRRDYYRVFSDRAYPKNCAVLNDLVNTRDQLAEILGYKSYADLDLDSEMAETVTTVEKFLDQVTRKANDKANNEWVALLKDLPESVTLTTDGKVKPWDLSYLTNHYKKTHLKIDNDLIAEYFPINSTLQGLLSVYEKFLSVKFKILPSQGFWDPSVQFIEVRQNGNEQNILGYVLMDLFPRENKFSHACCSSIIPPMTFDNGKSYQPALAIIIANFAKPTETKPSLLKHHDVETLFHEFGHTMHALFGRSEMPSKGAYNTKTDFVETPSQYFEEWVWDPNILKMLSKHYKTGDALPDQLIQTIIATKEFNEGNDELSQVKLAKFSLEMFKAGKDKDLVKLAKDQHEKYLSQIAYDPESHYMYSFGHLTAYGPKYYGYLWSKDLSRKLYAYTKTNGGPLSPVCGQRYISKVIGKGGGCDPNQLVSDFLSESQ